LANDRDADVAALFFSEVLAEARARDLVSDEHFTVDGTLLEAWASLKSFKKIGDDDSPPSDDSKSRSGSQIW
jgi:transposase